MKALDDWNSSVTVARVWVMQGVHRTVAEPAGEGFQPRQGRADLVACLLEPLQPLLALRVVLKESRFCCWTFSRAAAMSSIRSSRLLTSLIVPLHWCRAGGGTVPATAGLEGAG